MAEIAFSGAVTLGVRAWSGISGCRRSDEVARRQSKASGHGPTWLGSGSRSIAS
ncbi:hypothetical protein HC891_06195 [Candidatus Gracilibacteria bacterium]|nr:hypothetical protein [Candidatus Gracilibacteria bacterium]